MKNTVVVGAQFGDEGKAKITDLLALDADFITRFQGGSNAGHTVVVDGKKYYRFRSLSSFPKIKTPPAVSAPQPLKSRQASSASTEKSFFIA